MYIKTTHTSRSVCRQTHLLRTCRPTFSTFTHTSRFISRFMNPYTHTYMYDDVWDTHTHTHEHKHTRKYKHTHARTRAHTHTHIQIWMCTCIWMLYIYMYMWTRTHTDIWKYDIHKSKSHQINEPESHLQIHLQVSKSKWVDCSVSRAESVLHTTKFENACGRIVTTCVFRSIIRNKGSKSNCFDKIQNGFEIFEKDSAAYDSVKWDGCQS